VNADEREEIAASVAAHAELGPRYDAAVAEGLVERIGEEIDRRVDARLRTMNAGGMAAGQQQAVPRQAYLSPGQQIVPPGYPGGQAAHGGQPATAGVAGAAGAAPAPAQPQVRRSSGVTGMILGLGSMGIGIGATAAVVSHHIDAVAQVLIVLLVWLAIVVINIAHSQRR
jgi:hypothetical protein